MDDNVIDLTKYLERTADTESAEGAGTARRNFSVWGGEGERSRFALPLWRSIYLVGGGRGGILWEDSENNPGYLVPFFVLDLSAEPARLEFSYDLVGGLDVSEAPSVLESDRGLGIYLGTREGRQWYLVVDERDAPTEVVEGSVREDLLFLSGECAGLLFFKELGLGLD